MVENDAISDATSNISPMDFFQHQDKAKSRTVLLVILYCLGLLGLLAIVVAVTLLYCHVAGIELNRTAMILCIGGLLVLVVGGSLFKALPRFRIDIPNAV